MEIPGECAVWEEAMEDGNDTRQVLNNLRTDPVLGEDISAEFVRHLVERIARIDDPLTPEDAWRIAWEIVHANSASLTCCGDEVTDALFELLLRFCSVDALRYTIPDDVLDALGLTDHELWDDPADEDLAELTDEYDGEVILSNLLQIVWATAFAAVEPHLHNPDELVRRLAIRPSRYVLCVYNSEEAGQTLHVPTCIDAIDHPLFRVSDDPSPPHGRTVPASGPPEDGLPEAVHRRCQVVPSQWRLVEF